MKSMKSMKSSARQVLDYAKRLTGGLVYVNGKMQQPRSHHKQAPKIVTKKVGEQTKVKKGK